MINGHYKTAQICINGHTITSSAESADIASKHCSKCGAETITQCLKCKAPIRGIYYTPAVFTFQEYVPPAYCHECGEPYPWTQARIDSLKTIIEYTDSLDDVEKATIYQFIPDIITETPNSPSAAMVVGKILKKASSDIILAIKDWAIQQGATAIFQKLIGG